MRLPLLVTPKQPGKINHPIHMFDYVFFIVIILNTTGLFRFLAPVMGFNIGHVSLGLMLLTLFYIYFRKKILFTILPSLLPWFGLLVFWPLATLFYTPRIEPRQIGLVFYSFLLFVGVVVYASRAKISAVSNIFYISFIVAIFGQFLNLTMPDVFNTVATLADAQVLSLGRPGGFYLQPNYLGIALVFLFVGWLAFLRRDTKLLEPVSICVFMASLLVTGSRTAMILGAFLVILYLGHQLHIKLFRKNRFRFVGYRLVVLSGILLVFFVGANILVGNLEAKRGTTQGDLIDRMSLLLDLKLTDTPRLLESRSVQKRLEAQKKYLEMIWEKPLLGHGLGSEAYYLDEEKLKLTSHSTLLSVTLEYGIAFPLCFMVLFLKYFLNEHKIRAEKILGVNTITQFIVITMLVFGVAGDLFRRREFFVIFGVMFILLNNLDRFFSSPDL